MSTQSRTFDRYIEDMKSKFGTALALAAVLLTGTAAAAINTQALSMPTKSTLGTASTTLLPAVEAAVVAPVPTLATPDASVQASAGAQTQKPKAKPSKSSSTTSVTSTPTSPSAVFGNPNPTNGDEDDDDDENDDDGDDD